MIRLGGELLVQVVKRATGPEDFFELACAPFQGAERERLVDDDRPRPQARDQQKNHHGLHQKVGTHEQVYDRDAADRRWSSITAGLSHIDIRCGRRERFALCGIARRGSGRRSLRVGMPRETQTNHQRRQEGGEQTHDLHKPSLLMATREFPQ
ncbi:MAG: hypothetical protein WDM89_14870 [Rhizomicrobium sp.]